MRDRGAASCFVLVASSVLALTRMVAAAEPERRLFVIDLEATGVDAALARNLSEVLLASVRDTARDAAVLGQAEINSLLTMEHEKDLLGCESDVSCLAELGGALGADLLVLGAVGKVGTVFLLTLKLVDTRQTRVIRHVVREAPGSIEQLIATVRQMGASLIDPAQAIEPPPPTAPAATQPAAESRSSPWPLSARLSSGPHHALPTIRDGEIRAKQNVLAEPNVMFQVGHVWDSGLACFASASFYNWMFVLERGGDVPSLMMHVLSFGAGGSYSVGTTWRGSLGGAIELGKPTVRSSAADSAGFVYVPREVLTPVTIAFAGVEYQALDHLGLGVRATLAAHWTRGDFIGGSSNKLQTVASAGLAVVVVLGR